MRRVVATLFLVQSCLSSHSTTYEYQSDALSNAMGSSSSQSQRQDLSATSYSYQTDVGAASSASSTAVGAAAQASFAAQAALNLASVRFNTLMQGAFQWEELCSNCWLVGTSSYVGPNGETAFACQNRCANDVQCTGIVMGTGPRVGYCWVTRGGDYRTKTDNYDGVAFLPPYAHTSTISTTFWNLKRADFLAIKDTFNTNYQDGILKALGGVVGECGDVTVDPVLEGPPLKVTMDLTTMAYPAAVQALVYNASFSFPYISTFGRPQAITATGAIVAAPAFAPVSAPGSDTCCGGTTGTATGATRTGRRLLQAPVAAPVQAVKPPVSSPAMSPGFNQAAAPKAVSSSVTYTTQNGYGSLLDQTVYQSTLLHYAHSFTTVSNTRPVAKRPFYSTVVQGVPAPTGQYYPVCPTNLQAFCTLPRATCRMASTGFVYQCCRSSNLPVNCLATLTSYCWVSNQCPAADEEILAENGYVRGKATVVPVPGKSFSIGTFSTDLALKLSITPFQIQVREQGTRTSSGISTTSLQFNILLSTKERDAVWSMYYSTSGSEFSTTNYVKFTIEGNFIDLAATCNVWQCSRVGGLCSNGDAVCCNSQNKLGNCPTPPCWHAGSTCPIVAPPGTTTPATGVRPPAPKEPITGVRPPVP